MADPTVASALDQAMSMQAAIHPQGEPTPDELELINRQHALKPLTADKVYVFRMEISNDLIDSYHTRMDPATTLPNYVDDFKDGRSIVNSHDTDELPPGRSFDATLERRGTEGDPADPARTAAVLKAYIPRGIQLGKVHNDHLIQGIEAGVVRDGSVHFNDDARFVCSLCGGDMYERESACPHLPGLTYSGKRAQATIVDAHAIEGSLVFDGSTPKAMVDKARRMAAAGQLSDKAVALVERRYRTRIRDRAAIGKAVPGAGGKPRTPAELAGLGEPDLDDLPGTPPGDNDGDEDDARAAKLAYEDRQKALSAAISALYPGDDEWAYIDRTTDADVAWTVSGGPKAGSWQATYSIGDDGKAALGKPEPVNISTTVTPINRAGGGMANLNHEHEHDHGDMTHSHQHEHAPGVEAHGSGDDVAHEHMHEETAPDRYVELLPQHVREAVEFLGGGDPAHPDTDAPWSGVLIAARASVVRDKKRVAWLGMTALERAVWTTAYMNDLPDSAFAYIEPGGEKDGEGKTTPRSLRHFPHHDSGGKPDEAHVRNALARIPQSSVGDSAKSSALSHVKAHAKTLGIEVDDGKSQKSAATGGAMENLDPETFVSLAGLAFKSQDDRSRMLDAIVGKATDEVTPDFVTRVAAGIVKRAGPPITADVQSQVQGILDKMADASDAHAEAQAALKSLVGMGAEGGLQYGLPENMASQEDLNAPQDPALSTFQYGPGATPNGSGNGSQPANGSIGGGRAAGNGARSIEMGAGAPLAEAVKAALGQVLGIISDLMATDAQEDEQDVEQQAAEQARPLSSEAIGMGRKPEDHEARVRRVQEFERAVRLDPALSPVRKLVEQARAGARYRRVLVKEYLEWGVRARGEKFNLALQRRLLPAYDLDALEQLTREFEAEAYKRFANAPAEEHPDWMPSLAGRIGRQTVPGLLPGTPPTGAPNMGKFGAAVKEAELSFFTTAGPK